jgi:hypothetical protein
VIELRKKLASSLSHLFALLGISVLLSGSLVFLLFVLGMAAGRETGAFLAAFADRLMGISLWLALLTTMTGMLQMYAARETALQMDSKSARQQEEEARLRQIEEGLEQSSGD